MLRTQVGIIGAGPAGLLLAHLLQRRGIDSIVIESRTRSYCEERVRAGVLEQDTVDVMIATGVGERLMREAMFHKGIWLAFEGTRHFIPIAELNGGRSIVVYAQHEVVIDLIAARMNAGGPILFEAEGIEVDGIDSSPRIRFKKDNK